MGDNAEYNKYNVNHARSANQPYEAYNEAHAYPAYPQNGGEAYPNGYNEPYPYDTVREDPAYPAYPQNGGEAYPNGYNEPYPYDTAREDAAYPAYPQDGGEAYPNGYNEPYPYDAAREDPAYPAYPQDGGEAYPSEYNEPYPYDAAREDAVYPAYPQDGGEAYPNGYNEPYATNASWGQPAYPAYPHDADPYLSNAPDEKPAHRTLFKPRMRKPNFALSVAVQSIRLMALIILTAGLCAVGAVIGIAKGYVDTAPNLDLARVDDQEQTSFIYDAESRLITEYKGIENRVMVSIKAMPIYLQHAFVACDDARFYTHSGVDLKRIVGAFISNLSSSSTQGGSTITQQLIKQTILSDEQSYKRKIQEAYLAIQLETEYSKEEILEAYLNTIYLGENYYGVQVAAEGYFGKALKDLSLRECAMMAGMTRNPYYYNPRRNFYVRNNSGGTDYTAITNDRTDYVLRCMRDHQFITERQYQDALSVQTAHVLTEAPGNGAGMYKYAHYVEYAVRDIVNAFLTLEKLENTAENRYRMEQKLRTGGYRVMLAIDTGIQEIVESTLENYKNYPALRDPADKVYRPRNADGTYTDIIQPQAAAVVLDYRTGELKAIVGGRTRPTQRKTLNRATDMKMPVGSSIKPIAVYAPAIELGGSPASIVYNIPVPIQGWKNAKGEDSWPQNFGGGGYVGAETLRKAMNSSHNTAAAQALMTLVGIDRSVDYLLQMGVNRDHIDATPFGLSLGSSGITPLQMSVAFGTLANGGIYQQPISFLGISDASGTVIWDSHARQTRRQVFKHSTSFMIVDMLKTAISNGTGSAAKMSGQTVGGKTGTNSDSRGISFTGVTGYYVSSVWIGHDNYKPLSGKTTAANSAIPLWKAYMTKIHEGLPNRDILPGNPEDYGVEKLTTCAVSGQLATEACRADAFGYGTTTDYWAKGAGPITECQMHKVMMICRDSKMLATDFCPFVSVGNSGVIVIPKGHPLYPLIGTKYDDTLRKHFGDFATLQYTADADRNAALNSMIVCTLHNAYTQHGGDYVVETTLRPDAESLLAQAQLILSGVTDPDMYQALEDAILNLSRTLDQENLQAATLTTAMSYLTQVIASLR